MLKKCAEILTSTVDMREESGGRPVSKAKVRIRSPIKQRPN